MSSLEQLAMPMKLKALQTKIAHRTGYHFYWEYGFVTPGWNEAIVPTPKAVGLTARLFGFCSGSNGQTDVRLLYSEKYYVSAVIIDREFGTYPRGYTTTSDVKKVPTKKIPQLDLTFFSIAVRIHKSDELCSLYEENVMFTENVGDILGYEYHLGFKSAQHSIISMHITNEVTELAPPDYWGSATTAPYFFPTNTVCVYTVYVKKSNPVDVYIQLVEGSGGTESFTNKVNEGQELCFVVTLLASEYMVSVDFDPNKPAGFRRAPKKPRSLSASFPTELVLKKVEVVSAKPY